MELIEQITWNGRPLALIIRANADPERTTFVTPPEFQLQIGFIVYSTGGEIGRHVHRSLERHIVGLVGDLSAAAAEGHRPPEQDIVGIPEVLLVKKGRCEVDIYNEERELVATRELRAGEILVIAGCGHGFRMLEDTVFLEIKQGPYIGLDEKERF